MSDGTAVLGTLERATPDDAQAIVALRSAVGCDLTARFGAGHWSSAVSEKGVLRGITTSMVCVLRRDREVIATVRLSTSKPWAIDTAYFTPVARPLYLTDMAVHPALQRRGIGRWCMEQTKKICADWPAGALRLDAYDADAGAGEFYRRCGFVETGRAKYRNTPLIYFETLL